MQRMITFILISIGLTAFGLAATRFGADSRPGFDGRRESERFGVLR